MVDISGTVTDEDGETLSGVKVIVIDESNDSVAATTTTANDGTYSVTVGSNSYHVLFSYQANGEDYNTDSYPYIA
jgi:hypothetical protein